MQTNTDVIDELPAKEKPLLLDKQKWMILISEWENSNDSQKAFCERNQLNINTFSYMRAQILSKQKHIENKFIAVKVKEDINISPQSKLFVIQNSN
jgi:hypothetical protein